MTQEKKNFRIWLRSRFRIIKKINAGIEKEYLKTLSVPGSILSHPSDKLKVKKK